MKTSPHIHLYDDVVIIRGKCRGRKGTVVALYAWKAIVALDDGSNGHYCVYLTSLKVCNVMNSSPSAPWSSAPFLPNFQLIASENPAKDNSLFLFGSVVTKEPPSKRVCMPSNGVSVFEDDNSLQKEANSCSSDLASMLKVLIDGMDKGDIGNGITPEPSLATLHSNLFAFSPTASLKDPWAQCDINWLSPEANTQTTNYAEVLKTSSSPPFNPSKRVLADLSNAKRNTMNVLPKSKSDHCIIMPASTPSRKLSNERFRSPPGLSRPRTYQSWY